MPHRDRGDSPRSFVCAKIRTPSRMKALDTERRSDPPPSPAFASRARLLRRATLARQVGTPKSDLADIPLRPPRVKSRQRRQNAGLPKNFYLFLFCGGQNLFSRVVLYGREQKGVKRPDALCVGVFHYEGAKHYPYAWLFILSQSHAAQFALLCFRRAPYQP